MALKKTEKHGDSEGSSAEARFFDMRHTESSNRCFGFICSVMLRCDSRYDSEREVIFTAT